MSLTRRAFLGALPALASCRRATATRPRDADPAVATASAVPAAEGASAARAAVAAPLVDVREVAFDAEHGGPEHAVLAVPRWSGAERLPVLVALHGRGESLKGMVGGAYGWARDYGLVRAMERLRAPPLTREDFQGFVDDARLARLNASLAARPFRGLVVACPWVPDILDGARRASLDAALPTGRFVVQRLLPRVVAEASASGEAPATGIDGVSLGGRASLVIGFANAARFGAVGSLQAAIQAIEATQLAERARRALAASPAMRVRLVTSIDDYFREPIATLHSALDAARVPHEHLVVPGPHDYPWNRGPGALEMLLFHDRALRGEPAL